MAFYTDHYHLIQIRTIFTKFNNNTKDPNCFCRPKHKFMVFAHIIRMVKKVGQEVCKLI